MAVSTENNFTPESGSFAWERPHGSPRLTEFTLSLSAPYRQSDLKYDNPLCLLAARTAAGANVCGQGCGMGEGVPCASHRCPFGLMMIQSPPAPGAASARWVGRRFTDASVMHAALDRLLAAGFDEETILAHLPPNPIATIEELRQAAGLRKDPSAEATHKYPAAVVQMTPARTKPARPEPDSRLGDLLEYFEQVNRLIAGAPGAAAACERFLRAVAAVVPADEMAIYLRGASGSEWPMAANIIGGVARESACVLDPDGLGAAAVAQGQVLMTRQGNVAPYAGSLEGPCTLALPFPLAGGRPVGVWLAQIGETPSPDALGGDVVRSMRLLAEFLATRLQQIEELFAARTVPEAPVAAPQPVPAPDPALTLVDKICAEVARGARHEQPFTLLCLRARSRASQAELPCEHLTREFAVTLRPYDTLLADPQAAGAWFAVLPYVQDAQARLVAARLMMVFEDVMDAHGGAEEQGARLAVGASIWGADAVDPEEMIVHAAGAAAMAEAEEASAIQFFSNPAALAQVGLPA